MSYPITDIEGIDGEVATVLKSVGIRSTDRLLEAARTVKGRKLLATKTGFNEKQLLCWANVADRMRIKGVRKEYADSFEDTDLENVLAKAGVGRLVVTGAQTDACVRSTIHGALVRGYDVTLVGDAHTTEDLSAWGAPPPEQVIAHTNLYWREQRAPGRHGDVKQTADVSFDAPG